MSQKVAVIIPTRLASTRLKRKPLLEIDGKPMVVNVAEKAVEAEVGDVYVACADQEIADLCRQYGYECIVTDPAIKTGTDRVYATLQKLEKDYDYIVNLQGDLPSISPHSICSVVDSVIDNSSDIGTLVTVAKTEKEKTDPNMVRAIFTESGRALYFTRASYCPSGDGELYHHVGIYAFTKNALERFVNLPQSPLEKREKLEQLRALENGMKISVSIVDDFAHGVDTEEDYQIVKSYMEA
jgi:3-deoxy-manno-octulosonate cytidylyltransferase (CMP-KDO synthetase)